VSTDTVVVGLGNPYRRDDGVGVAAAAALGDRGLAHVRAVIGVADPMGLLEAWSGAALAIVIDAAVTAPSMPGRVRRCTLAELADTRDGLSSHTVDICGAHALSLELARAPDALVVFTVDVADTGHGEGLTAPVARAVPEVVRRVLAEIDR
jgi:hydrogenase maturation protease